MANGKQDESKNCPLVLIGHTCGSCAYSRQSFFKLRAEKASSLLINTKRKGKKFQPCERFCWSNLKKRQQKKRKRQQFEVFILLPDTQNYMVRRIEALVTVIDVKATNESSRATWFIFYFFSPKLWLQVCFLSRKIPLSSCVLICICNLRDIWAQYGHTPPAP